MGSTSIRLHRGTRLILIRLAAGGDALARRARIVLLAADGQTNKEIAGNLPASERIAGRWRARFKARGIAGLKERRGGARRKTATSAV